MEHHKLLIPEKALNILIALVFAPMILLLMLKMFHINNPYFFYVYFVSLIAHFIIFLIVLVDMIKNKFDYKPFWIVSLFVFNFVATYLYLYRRETMLEKYTLENQNGQESPKKFNKLVIAFISVSILVIPIGAIMKIYHLPGAGTMLYIGLIVEALFIIFLLVQSRRKK